MRQKKASDEEKGKKKKMRESQMNSFSSRCRQPRKLLCFNFHFGLDLWV